MLGTTGTEVTTTQANKGWLVSRMQTLRGSQKLSVVTLGGTAVMGWWAVVRGVLLGSCLNRSDEQVLSCPGSTIDRSSVQARLPKEDRPITLWRRFRLQVQR